MHTTQKRRALSVIGMGVLISLVGIRGSLLSAQMTSIEGASTIAEPPDLMSALETMHGSAPAIAPTTGSAIALLVGALAIIVAIYVHARIVIARREREMREGDAIERLLCIRIC
ncbi:hypothetical protein COU80_02210 [Candidatus Peregrinibacteria bacterium CG10_big_fil_rev_8_21_14_0_10_55_24]|nr:MAG: hypothetical protein COU80_02210 [Candidatus Peregrinibacteria bacterium CG10_big_fil_rev_8_21_14_0_10_55_24]